MSKEKVDMIAACGLYCGACKQYLNSSCLGCTDNVKATWCKVRACVIENGYRTCADCTITPLKECKKYNSFISKVFGFVFRSDRAACIDRIKMVGREAFAVEMDESKRQTIKR